MVELLRSPWAARFEKVVARARRSLILCSPYVAATSCARVRDHVHVADSANSRVQLTILTDLSRENMLSGATDVGAIRTLAARIPETSVRFLPSLHAKVYVADESQAVVTSGNLTEGGLVHNFEYGAVFDDPATVRTIRADVLRYASLGSPIDDARLAAFASVVEELRDMRAAAERRSRSRIRREFDRRLREMDDDLLRTRAGGRTAHAIFADTILYLLARGPLRTVELHKAIQRIHPDLCDDSLDRVIDGRHFGKKWKHGVRTAQVYLRRKGEIERKGDRWRLTIDTQRRSDKNES